METPGVVREAAGMTGDFLRRQVDRRSTAVGDQFVTTAQNLRTIAEQLRSSDSGIAAALAESIAERADEAGRYLREADINRLMADADRVVSNSPVVFTAAALVAGISVARFLKASRRSRPRETVDDLTGTNGTHR